MRIYNSLPRKKELFVPIKKREVSMYVCGITPYDTTHLGHAFTYIFFDIVYRYLTYKGYKVTYVQNVTDIDDDILKKAKEVGKNWKELGDFWTNRFLVDMKSLNILPPTYYVKATDSVTTILRIIRVLLEKGFAYIANGNVYFSVEKFKKYGQLSRFTESEMNKLLNERGGNTNDPLKNHQLDFILWQQSRPEDDEPAWDSPWGKGRPGWHIECSAMNFEYLGEQIDIHGGGHDLIFPHHESEIAQSESFTGHAPFAKYWIHTAMLRYRGQKMSKSLGNLIMVSDLLKKYSANAIRYLLLSHHYRQPWEFEEKELSDAEKNIEKLLARYDYDFTNNSLNDMDDDFNIPKILKQKILPVKVLSILGFVV